MSAALAPSQFLPLPGLLLPPSARLDRAYTQTIQITPADNRVYTEKGGTFDALIALSFVFSTSAVAANRLISGFVQDPSGTLLYSFSSPEPQVASQNIDYTFSTAVTAASFAVDSNGNGVCIAPVPVIAIPPGFEIWLSKGNGQVGDVYVLHGTVSLIRIPAGPPLTAEQIAPPPLPPTPVLV